MTDGLRMGVVARRAGVPVSTVRYYLDQGLLPDPVRKSRNMAWYSEATVERVQLIRELQRSAFIPLKVIREMFERTTDPDEIRRLLRKPGLRPGDEDTTPADEFLGAAPGAFAQKELDRLANMGLLSPREVDGGVVYSRLDAELLHVLRRMRAAGLTSERGFHADALNLYVRPLEQLVRAEVALAFEGLVGRVSPDEAESVATEILGAATDLVAVIHAKLVERILGELAGSK